MNRWNIWQGSLKTELRDIDIGVNRKQKLQGVSEGRKLFVPAIEVTMNFFCDR
jgi:hypothetical protein